MHKRQYFDDGNLFSISDGMWLNKVNKRKINTFVRKAPLWIGPHNTKFHYYKLLDCFSVSVFSPKKFFL